MVEHILNDLHPVWDIRLVLDQFLGALGAGAFLAALFASGKSKKTAKLGATIGAIAVIVGILLMMSELGNPIGAIRVFFSFRHTSMFFWGSYIQAIFIVLAFLYAGSVGAEGKEGSAKILGTLGGIFAVGVTVYHGLFMSVLQARPVWNNGAIPVLSLVSGLTTGFAAVNLLLGLGAQDSETQETSGRLGKFLTWALLAQLVALGIFLFTSRWSNAGASVGHIAIIGNSLFWLLVVIGGLVLPIIMGLGKKPIAPAVIALLVLVGGFALRLVLMNAGLVNAVLNLPVPFEL